jgi:hypothetical protein
MDAVQVMKQITRPDAEGPEKNKCYFLNMSGGTPEKAKLPAEQNMTSNATNTTITEGVSPNFTG